jgi:hypothetical protein
MEQLLNRQALACAEMGGASRRFRRFDGNRDDVVRFALFEHSRAVRIFVVLAGASERSRLRCQSILPVRSSISTAAWPAIVISAAKALEMGSKTDQISSVTPVTIRFLLR